MSDNRKGFLFYDTWFDSINDLDAKDQLPMYKAICEYAFNDEITIKLPRYAGMLFKVIKPQIDANKARLANGAKGGRPSKKETKNIEEE